MKKKIGDVVIIGGGIHGRATAAELAPDYNVTLFEQFGPTHIHGSSHGRDRATRPSPGEGKIFHPMQAISVQRFEELGQKTKLKILREGGGFLAADMTGRLNPHSWIFANCDVCDRKEIVDNCMRGHQLNKLDPYFNLHREALVVLQPGFRRIAAADAMHAYRTVAESEGAILRFNTPVASIDYERKSVKTADGKIIHADKIIIAAGSWVKQLLGKTYALPVTSEQHDVAYFRFAKEPDATMRTFVYEKEIGTLEKPRSIIYYGMPSDGCMKFGNHSRAGRILEPGQECGPPDPRGIDNLISFVKEHTRNINPDPVKIDRCKYTRTKDDYFLIDKHPAYDDIFIVSACSGHGFKHAPAVAMVVRELVDSRPCGFNKKYFALSEEGKLLRLMARAAAQLPLPDLR